MIHLVFIPIIFVFAIIRLVSLRYEMKLFGFISKLVIIISAILLIYFFLDYKGFNIILYLRNLLHT